MRTRDTSATERPSPRIAAVLALEEPSLAAVAGYLADPDAGVRRIAVATLDEHLPDGYHSALVDALSDADPGVRRETAEAVRELVEVLPDPGAFAVGLGAADPVVRAVTVHLLSSRQVGTGVAYRAALTDPDHRVRIEAVRALVSVDDDTGVAAATADENREVRIAAVGGLATLRTGAGAVRPVVADPAVAVPTLTRALSDRHLDVRKAAVLSLSRWADSEAAARHALTDALADGDADVRAYARHALSRVG